jgi:hypothetical protein
LTKSFHIQLEADERLMPDFLRGNVLVIAVTGILGFFSRCAVFPYALLYVLAFGGTADQIAPIDSST